MQKFFGIRIDELTTDQLIQKIINEIAFIKKYEFYKTKLVFANHNLHSLYFSLKDKVFAKWINSQYVVFIDGIGIICLGKLFGKSLNRTLRTTFIDLMPDLLKKLQDNNFKVFYLGATKDHLEKGINKIKSLYPKLNIYGQNGYELEDSINLINDFQPDILLVGMGMPLQELWIKENIEKLNCKIILPCGAAIDYYADATKIPPRWSGKIGLEWLFRFVYDPKRLWKRYILEPIYILIRLILWKWWK